MVAVECELPVKEVMSPKFEGLDDGVEFPVVIGISALGLTEFLAEEGYRVRS